MPLGTLTPSPWIQIFDPLTGQPANGALIETYLSGLGTPEFTFRDAALLVEQTNPVQCDAAGVAVIYLASKSYKFIVKRADGSTIRTIDPVSAVQLSESFITDIVPLGGSPALGTTDAAYPAGATLDKILFGTCVASIDSVNASGTWVLRGMLRSDSGVSAVTAALVNLSDGAPNTPLVEITSASAIGQLVTSAQIAFAAGGVGKDYAVKLKVAAGFGQAWDLELVRTA